MALNWPHQAPGDFSHSPEKQ